MRPVSAGPSTPAEAKKTQPPFAGRSPLVRTQPAFEQLKARLHPWYGRIRRRCHCSQGGNKNCPLILDKYVPLHVCWLCCREDVVSLDKQGMFPLWELGRWRAGESEFCGQVSRISPQEACAPWKFVRPSNYSVFWVVAIKANLKRLLHLGVKSKKKNPVFHLLTR